MVPTVTLPYYASNIPCPLPTASEINAAAPNVSLAYGGRRIVEIGEHSVVKFGKGVNLIEGENIFVQEKHQHPGPSCLCALFGPCYGEKLYYYGKNPRQSLRGFKQFG